MIWCVADRRRRSYIRALHTRFYREPELWSTRAALEHTCRKIKGNSVTAGGSGERTAGGDLPGTFIAGFQLGMGIAGGLEPYSFEDAEEKQATEWVKTGRPHVKD